jgi:hypothetical protein
MTNYKICGDIHRNIFQGMPFLNKLAKKLPTWMLRNMYYSAVGSKLVKIYTNVNKDNDKLEVNETRQGFKMYHSPAVPSERAII